MRFGGTNPAQDTFLKADPDAGRPERVSRVRNKIEGQLATEIKRELVSAAPNPNLERLSMHLTFLVEEWFAARALVSANARDARLVFICNARCPYR